MADLVGTCPKDFWEEWLAEGDAAGDPPTGQEWGWYTASLFGKEHEAAARRFSGEDERPKFALSADSLRNLDGLRFHGGTLSAHSVRRLLGAMHVRGSSRRGLVEITRRVR